MTTAPPITAKQQKVLDYLAQGLAPSEIAKRLHISGSGVYGHMRNMRAAGITLPGEYGANGDSSTPPTPPAAAAPPALMTEDEPGLADPEATLRAAITRDEERMTEIDTEVKGLNEQIGQLDSERTKLEQRTDKYAKALEALA